MTPVTTRRPDALDLFDAIVGAAIDLNEIAWLIFDEGDGFGVAKPEYRDMLLSRVRLATANVLAALDAYEART